MAVATNDTYSAASGETIYGGRSAPSTLPAWRQAMSQWQWAELAGTAALSGAQPDDTTGLLASGGLSGRVNAWNGFCARGSTVYLAAAGGHADYYGNEAYAIDLSAAAPAWTILCQPTPASDVILDSGYYADGRPTSSHLYYALHAVGDEVVRVFAGSTAGGGNTVSVKIAAFDLPNGDWLPEATYTDAPNTSFGRAICQDPRDGSIYFAASTRLYRRDADGSWAQLASIPSGGSALYYAASAVDTTRNRVVFFADAYQTAAGGIVFDITAGTFSKITFTGTPAASSSVIGPAGNTARYDAALDKFLLKSAIGDDVYVVDPATWEIVQQATTGGGSVTNATNGVFNKFVDVPSLGGIFYQPNHASNGWFLATE